MTVYDNAAEAEAARAAGVEVDYSTEVRGDDGLTDDERRLEKIKRGEEAQVKSDAERARQERANDEEPGTRGRTTSAGNKSEQSSEKDETDADNTKQDRPSTAPTTERTSNAAPKASGSARSTGTSGKANR